MSKERDNRKPIEEALRKGGVTDAATIKTAGDEYLAMRYGIGTDKVPLETALKTTIEKYVEPSRRAAAMKTFNDAAEPSLGARIRSVFAALFPLVLMLIVIAVAIMLPFRPEQNLALLLILGVALLLLLFAEWKKRAWSIAIPLASLAFVVTLAFTTIGPVAPDPGHQVVERPIRVVVDKEEIPEPGPTPKATIQPGG